MDEQEEQKPQSEFQEQKSEETQLEAVKEESVSPTTSHTNTNLLISVVIVLVIAGGYYFLQKDNIKLQSLDIGTTSTNKDNFNKGNQWQFLEGNTIRPQQIEVEVGGQAHTAFSLRTRMGGDTSGVYMETTIPSEANRFEFSYYFPKGGDGDWLTVTFNGEVLWSFLAKTGYEVSKVFELTFEDANVLVGNVAGKTGKLEITMHGNGQEEAEVLIANYRFVQFGSQVNNSTEFENKTEQYNTKTNIFDNTIPKDDFSETNEETFDVKLNNEVVLTGIYPSKHRHTVFSSKPDFYSSRIYAGSCVLVAIIAGTKDRYLYYSTTPESYIEKRSITSELTAELAAQFTPQVIDEGEGYFDVKIDYHDNWSEQYKVFIDEDYIIEITQTLKSQCLNKIGAEKDTQKIIDSIELKGRFK